MHGGQASREARTEAFTRGRLMSIVTRSHPAGFLVIAIAVASLLACTSDDRDEPLTVTSSPTSRGEVMVAKPQPVAAGRALSLTFPERSLRGVAFRLHEMRDGSWVPLYTLISDAAGSGEPQWMDAGNGESFSDVGVSGSGPDWVIVPPETQAGSYRLCTASAQERLCATIEVTGS